MLEKILKLGNKVVEGLPSTSNVSHCQDSSVWTVDPDLQEQWRVCSKVTSYVIKLYTKVIITSVEIKFNVK